ncbi:glycosyltransferase family 2 protein [Psychrilyobacter sp.]|uniref:glycosyltransferase family 2 protein n=1 Tax=Psychrilyobacter sp. TaxID=2586924 RepID=UPI00301972D8
MRSRCNSEKRHHKKGKGYALEYAFDKLKDLDYDLYLIVDADSVVEESYFLSILDGYRKGFEVMQGGYFVKNRVNTKNKLMNLALLVFHGVRPYARGKLGASVDLFGNGFAVSKKVITEIPYRAYSIVEDVEYHLKLIDKNKKVHYIKEAKLYADFPISKEGTTAQRARWEGAY